MPRCVYRMDPRFQLDRTVAQSTGSLPRYFDILSSALLGSKLQTHGAVDIRIFLRIPDYPTVQ